MESKKKKNIGFSMLVLNAPRKCWTKILKYIFSSKNTIPIKTDKVELIKK